MSAPLTSARYALDEWAERGYSQSGVGFSSDQRVDFFVAGMQKAGTTAVRAFLKQHPELKIPKDEVHFFDNEDLDWAAPDYSLLHSYFESGASTVRGETTPIYTYWPNALRRLQRYNPAAKVIVGLRHPTFRAYSQWRMETSRHAETLSFAEAIRIGRERVEGAPGRVHRVFSYVERGFYDTQVERLLALFPRQQLLFFRTDCLFEHPRTVLSEIQQFLGVTEVLEPETTYVTPLEPRDIPALDEGDRTYLDDLFAASIARTRTLTGLDLSDWLRADYAEPMKRP